MGSTIACSTDPAAEVTPATTIRSLGTMVWLGGEHDASTAAALRAALAGAAMAMKSDVVVDLSGVEFMASATVGVLAEARAGLAAQARALTLQSPSGPARRVLGLCQLPLAV